MTWLLAGVMAAISIAGTSLHGFLGIEHAPAPCQSTGGTLQISTLAQSLADEEGVCDEANCPVCTYLSQGQIAGEYVAVVASSLCVDNHTALPQLSVPAANFPVFDARGPPAAV